MDYLGVQGNIPPSLHNKAIVAGILVFDLLRETNEYCQIATLIVLVTGEVSCIWSIVEGLFFRFKYTTKNYIFNFQKTEKTDNNINLSKTCISAHTTQQLHQVKSQQIVKVEKSIKSILKQFE